MIYLKNNTETQAIYISRQTVLGGGYIPSTKAYDKGYNDGLEVGKEQQKSKLESINITENGHYEAPSDYLSQPSKIFREIIVYFFISCGLSV